MLPSYNSNPQKRIPVSFCSSDVVDKSRQISQSDAKRVMNSACLFRLVENVSKKGTSGAEYAMTEDGYALLHKLRKEHSAAFYSEPELIIF